MEPMVVRNCGKECNHGSYLGAWVLIPSVFFRQRYGELAERRDNDDSEYHPGQGQCGAPDECPINFHAPISDSVCSIRQRMSQNLLRGSAPRAAAFTHQLLSESDGQRPLNRLWRLRHNTGDLLVDSIRLSNLRPATAACEGSSRRPRAWAVQETYRRLMERAGRYIRLAG